MGIAVWSTMISLAPSGRELSAQALPEREAARLAVELRVDLGENSTCQEGDAVVLGQGFVVAVDSLERPWAYLLTASHVVADCLTADQRIQARLHVSPERSWQDAELVRNDAGLDIALLRVRVSGEAADRLRRGRWDIATARRKPVSGEAVFLRRESPPERRPTATPTRGRVSADATANTNGTLVRGRVLAGEVIIAFTSPAIRRGDSGAPLLNAQREIVGVVTAAGTRNIAAAIGPVLDTVGEWIGRGRTLDYLRPPVLPREGFGVSVGGVFDPRQVGLRNPMSDARRLPSMYADIVAPRPIDWLRFGALRLADRTTNVEAPVLVLGPPRGIVHGVSLRTFVAAGPAYNELIVDSTRYAVRDVTVPVWDGTRSLGPFVFGGAVTAEWFGRRRHGFHGAMLMAGRWWYRAPMRYQTMTTLGLGPRWGFRP